jgi:predicted transcriptional regulator of viral defense system
MFREKTRKIYETLKSYKGPLSTKEITAITGINYNTVRGSLQRLTKKGKIKRVGRGRYKA